MTERKVTIHVEADDAAAKIDLRELVALKDRLAKPATIKIKLDAPSGFKIEKFASTMRDLGKMKAKPSIEVSGLAGAIAGVRVLRAELNKLDGTHARVGASVGGADKGGGGGGGGFIMKTLSSFGGNFGNWFSSLSGVQRAGALAGLGPPAAGIGISAAGIVSALIEALIPTLIGTGIGGIGLMGAHSIDPKAFSAVTQALNQQFMMALTNQPNSQRVWDNNLGKRNGVLVSEGGGGPSFLKSVLVILNQISKFINMLGPSLGQMFRASVPFLKMWVQFGEQAAKIMLPAFVQAMHLMAPYLPIIEQGLLNVVKGFAGFIKALGPQGMKAGAQIFFDVTKVIEYVLIGLGKAIDFLAQLTVTMWHTWRVVWDLITHYFDTAVLAIRHGWDIFAHDFAHQFDATRHLVAHIWDSLWNDTTGRAIRGIQDVQRLIKEWWHELAVLWDGARHEVAHIWDMLWSVDLPHVLSQGATWIWNKMKWLGNAIINEIKKLPGQLLSLGKQALTAFWNGLKSIAPSILSWAKNFIGGLGSNPFGLIGIIGKALHIGSPSQVMFKIGAWTMQGLEHGLKSRIPHVMKLSGHIGGSVASWIKAAITGAHAPASWFPALERLISLESGGNPRAVNPQAVGGQHATGLWQMLPSTYASYAWGLPRGDLFNPIIEGISALRYIMVNYGSPFNIPGLMSGNYHGYWGGGWLHEPVFGFGTKSGSMYGFAEHGPEYVSRGGSGGNVYITVAGDTDPNAAANRIWHLLRDLKRTRGYQPLGIA